MRPPCYRALSRDSVAIFRCEILGAGKILACHRRFRLIRLCLNQAAGACSQATAVGVKYPPTGYVWDCRAAADPKTYPAGCVPDYTADHDSARPRLRLYTDPDLMATWVFGMHEQGAWMDTEPLYRAPPSATIYPDLSLPAESGRSWGEGPIQ
jgi:hypothetical protein